MKKYPKLKPPGYDASEGLMRDRNDVIYIVEKIDGANFRFELNEDNRLLFGSRNVVFSKNGDPLPIEETNKQFRHSQEYVRENVDKDRIEEVISERGRLTFFGESMHKHSVDYRWEGKTPDSDPNFIGFDIYNNDKKKFLDFEEILEIFDYIGLETVPIIDKTTVEDLDIGKIEIPKSKYREVNEDAESEFDRKGLAEGIVIINNSTKVRAKIVHENISEYSSPSKVSNYDNKNINKFVNRLVTDKRIEKNIEKLLNEKHYKEVSMKMMEELPGRVVEDALSEEGWKFLCDENEIHMEFDDTSKKRVRKKISNKCVDIIKEKSSN